MTEKYFIINIADGDSTIAEMTKDQLRYYLTPDVGGETWYGAVGDLKFFDKIHETEMKYWKNGLLIIKGSIVIPKTVEVVAKLEIE